ncbi:hypothetical protein [Paenibacillus ginsengarvi]|uniref:hypothetical protein n=1 Tax=Paenibacillus ginsengarvi TaxID=400777 RepID=UPI001960E074|nr:hypothetical protein [Paenibacillus ginsengarvi]
MIGKMQIVHIGDKAVQSKFALVKIIHLGMTELYFSTNLNIPESRGVWLEFEFRVTQHVHLVNGLLVWSRELEGIYEYGVHLTGANKFMLDPGFRIWREAIRTKYGITKIERYNMFEAEKNAKSSQFEVLC